MAQGGAVSRSVETSNPPGGVHSRRVPTKPPLHDPLLERILDRANMQEAWKRVQANQGAPGIDGMRVEEFPAFARKHWPQIRQALFDGTYQPSAVRRVDIPKRGGRGTRPLGIPTVLDRLICQAIAQVLTPIFDPDFSASSFGFRPGRSAHGARRQAQRHIREGYRFAVDLDLETFFDKVNHDVLMARVARKVRDKRLLALIGRYLRAGVLVGEVIQAGGTGTPQGSPLSPLLANILSPQYLRGWMNSFGISEYYRPVPGLDHWIRRRIRMCYWKQWRYARAKVRHLLALGTSKRQAIMTAIRRKSYGHLSKTLVPQTGMTNPWLASQGLLSVRDLWIKAQGYSSSIVVCFPVVNRPVRLPAAGRDPHAGWWGGWGLETPGYPIRSRLFFLLADWQNRAGTLCPIMLFCLSS